MTSGPPDRRWCQTCNSTGRLSGGQPCPFCRPSRAERQAVESINAAGAPNGRRLTVRELIEQHDRKGYTR